MGLHQARTVFVEMTLKKPFVETLKTQSESRRIRLEEFDFLHERIDWYRDRDEQKTISLNLEERKRMMDEDQEFIDAMEDRQRALAELNFESSDIKPTQFSLKKRRTPRKK